MCEDSAIVEIDALRQELRNVTEENEKLWTDYRNMQAKTAELEKRIAGLQEKLREVWT